MLVPFPIVCFVGTLISDIAYYATANMIWADFSAWLVTIGVIMGLLAAVAGLIDFLSPCPRPGAGLAAHARKHAGTGARDFQRTRAQS